MSEINTNLLQIYLIIKYFVCQLPNRLMYCLTILWKETVFQDKVNFGSSCFPACLILLKHKSIASQQNQHYIDTAIDSKSFSFQFNGHFKDLISNGIVGSLEACIGTNWRKLVTCKTNKSIGTQSLMVELSFISGHLYYVGLL